MFVHFWNSDAQVIGHVLAGHREEFGELIRRYEATVRSTALARVSVADDFEDIVQETFVTAYMRLDTLRDHRQFASWIAAIGRNTAISHVRKKRRIVMFRQNCASDQEVEDVDDAREDHYEILRTELQDLEPTYREVLLLYYFADLRIRQVADTLGLSVEAVKKRLQRARDQLGERIIARLSKETEGDKVREQRLARITQAVIAVPVTWELPAPSSLHTSLSNAWQVAGGKLTVATIVIATLGVIFWLGPRLLSPRSQGRDVSRVDIPEIAPAPDKSVSNGQAAQSAAINEPENTPRSPDRRTVTTVPASYFISEDGGYTALEQGPGVITGRVEFEDGRPAPNTRIEATRQRWDLHKLPNKDRLTFRTDTDANGQFVLRNLPLDRFNIYAFTETYHAIRTRVLCDFLPQVEVTMILQNAGSLSGQVVDESGNPSVGALVLPYFTEHENMIWHMQHCTLHGALTDGEGKFTLEHLWADGRWSVVAQAPGYESKVSERVPIETNDVRLQLVLGGVWEGRALFADNNEPVSGVKLQAIASGESTDTGFQNWLTTTTNAQGELTIVYSQAVASDESRETDFPDWLTTATNAQGEFKMSGLRSKTNYQISIIPIPNRLLLKAPLSVRVSEGGGTIRDTILVERGAGVSGQVRCAGTGAPVSKATISIQPMEVRESKDATDDTKHWRTYDRVVDVDEHGMYEFVGLKAGEYRVCAWYPCDDQSPSNLRPAGVRPLRLNGKPAIAQVTTTLGEDRTGVNFTVDPETQGRIAGSVLDSSGNPVCLAQICARPVEGGFFCLARSGEDGSFVLDDSRLFTDVYVHAFIWEQKNVGPQRPFPQVCWRVSLVSPVIGPLALGSADVDGIVLKLGRPRGHLEGTVFDEEGRLLNGVGIRISAQDIPSSANSQAEMFSGPLGEFKFEDLIPATYRVSLAFSDSVVSAGTVEVLGDEPVRGIELVFHPEANASADPDAAALAEYTASAPAEVMREPLELKR